MIRINRSEIECPAKLSGDGKKERIKNQKKFENGKDDFEFKSSIYGHDQVKNALINSQNGKCAYCEDNVSTVAYGDVEHYRPKGGWQQFRGQKLQKPGYYWLAYEWENLLYSCQKCNQSYKRNLFPLINPGSRAKSHSDDIANESPVLVNPLFEEPGNHLSFNQHIPIGLTENGKQTIELCGLDRKELNEARESLFSEIQMLLEIITQANEKDSLKAIAEKAKELIKKKAASSAPFSLMVRCAVKAGGIHL